MDLNVKFITKNFGKYDPMSIDSYLGIGGYRALKRALNMDGEDIASRIAEAKVKGRGGAAYDMGRKWSQSRAVKAPHKVVICNADECETCTFKDRELITNDPFNLIEAITICGYTVNA
ncbi:MAG: NADH-quinone oxidoreductase subunit F, partial [Schwartzia sp.]|nr:NADH-quinone oxidoreductase subunit F [Schwartzia sp. (in: firmicutes)]